MATKKAKERTQRALARAGKEAVQIEAERDRLAGELAEALSTASDLRMKLQLRDARVEHVEKTAADALGEKNRRIEELIEALVAAEQERDDRGERCISLELTLTTRTAERDRAVEDARAARVDVAGEAKKLADEMTKKLRRRVAELKAELAEVTGRFHRACTVLAKYDRDVVTKLFNEGRKSLREIEGRTAE